jgi:hypothetical protein
MKLADRAGKRRPVPAPLFRLFYQVEIMVWGAGRAHRRLPTGADFRDGALTSESARKDLVALVNTLLTLLQRLDPAVLGPPPLAAKFT